MLTQTVANRLTPIAIACLLALASAAFATSTKVSVLNSTGQTLRVVAYQLDHGGWWGTPGWLDPNPGTVPPGGVIKWGATQTGIATGDEGSVDMVTANSDEGHFHFYFDDPFIGSNSYSTSATGPFAVYRWGTGDGTGDDATIGWEIVRVKQQFASIPLPTSGPGSVSGTVRWRAAEGTPWVNPQGAFWQAVAVPALVPQTFEPVDPAFPAPNATTYNGQRGYFNNLQPAGQITGRPAASLPPGYYGFDYTISGLPVGVPVQLSPSVVDSVTWPPAANNVAPVGLMNAQYKRGLLALSGNTASLWPGGPTSAALSFEVVGVWSADSGGTGGGVAASGATLIARTKAAIVNPNPIMAAAVPLGVTKQRFNRQRLTDTTAKGGVTSLLNRTEIQALPQLQLQKGQLPQLRR